MRTSTTTRRATLRGCCLTAIAACLPMPALASTKPDDNEEPIGEKSSALPPYDLTTLCTKPGQCPCEAPCVWGEQALESLRRDGWPLLAGSAVA
jgi:hypothetical protein